MKGASSSAGDVPRHFTLAGRDSFRAQDTDPSAAVKVSLTALDLLQLLEGAARVALRGTHRLILRADPLLLKANLALLHADLLSLEAPALRVVPGAAVLVLGALVSVLDALDRFPDALLPASALGEDRAGQGERPNKNRQGAEDKAMMKRSHTFSFPSPVPPV